jgi:exopolysaccharide biosynthesis polyprenyl glycosylphosphotransferase
MNTSKRRLLLGTLKVFNLGLMGLCFGLATALVFSDARGGVPFSDFLSVRVKLWNFAIVAMVIVVWHLVFSMFGFYGSTRLATWRSLISDTIIATTVAVLCFAVVAQLFRIRMATPRFLVLLWVLSSVFVLSARVIIRYLLHTVRRRGRNLRHMLVLGTNSRAMEFASRIEARSELGYRVLGFVDDEWPGLQEFRKSDRTLCCDFDGLAEYLRRNVIDEVAIYLPLQSFYTHTSQVVTLCEQHGIVMRFDSDIFNLRIARSRADDFEGYSHITARADSLDGWPILAKRALDVVVSCLLLVVLSPLLAIVALLVKCTSEGPALFLQERVGLNKRRFRMCKFRTMVSNAEKMLPELETLNEVAGPVFKIRNDPRMTAVGRFLRRASIDELPQLFNVLKGDMSLVGPRPLPVRDYEGFSEDWQRRRFSIRPGITCLWQVNGRSSISFEQWMRLDLQYIDEWSLWLDLKILARTVPAVLKGSGAA